MLKKRNDLHNIDEIKELKEDMVMNSLNVLFKRGVHGCYIYAHDPKLRNKLMEMYQVSKK